MGRLRLKLKSTILRVPVTRRPKEYLDLRYWWLHELRQLRARRKYAGGNVKREMKVAQKELVRLRKEYS